MKRKTKRIMNYVLEGFNYIGFLIGLAMVLSSVTIFYTGLHNTDLSVNVLRISYFEDLNYSKYCDRYSLDETKCASYDTGYILGFTQMVVAFWLGLCGMFIVGIYIPYYVGAKFKEDDRVQKV